MAKEEAEDKQEEVPVKKKSSVKLIIIILIALLVVGGGVAGGLYFLGHKGETDKKDTKKPAAPLVGPLWSLDPFIVNLAENQGERFLKIVIQLELSDPAIIADMEILKPKIRDNLLDLLTAKTYAELMEPAGKQRLRDEIVLRLNSFLTKGKVLKVYFTEFIVQ
ncbi:MAG: flagellar basal body-associated FliL family protein [Syntrophales bacterium]|jgi:flagellar FliL protein|nr:flagellar basal body-associated FliL family protein [Syntrophales bacterium]